MGRFIEALAGGLLALLLSAAAAHAQTSSTPPRVFTAAEEARINALVERDRPRDRSSEFEFNPYDADRRDEQALEKHWKDMQRLRDRYRAQRRIADLRAMQDLANRFGLRMDHFRFFRFGHALFWVLHETGPATNDPEARADPVLAQERHRRYMRILAMHAWMMNINRIDQYRTLAGYIAECERRPSNERPTGNNHDPSCGYWTDATYKLLRVGDADFEPRNVPRTLTEFATDAPNPHGQPDPYIGIVSFTEYPLHLAEGAPGRNGLWAGNQAQLAALYARPYTTTREYQMRLATERRVLREQAEAREAPLRAARMAAIDRDIKLYRRWTELWPRQIHSDAEQLELESIAFDLNMVDVYTQRYYVASESRIRGYCARRYYPVCDALLPPPTIAAAPRVSSGGAWSPPTVSVTVRSYDRNGNYTGSTTTTPAIASLMGAR